MARPTKLNDKVQEAIVESVRGGNYIETSARAAGIHPDTLRSWRARGEEGGEANAPYVEFLAALTCAEAEAEQKAVKALGDAFGDDWRAASEYLRRRHPDRWSTNDRLQGKVVHSGKVEHEVSGQIDGEIEQFMEKLAAAREDSASS